MVDWWVWKLGGGRADTEQTVPKQWWWTRPVFMNWRAINQRAYVSRLARHGQLMLHQSRPKTSHRLHMNSENYDYDNAANVCLYNILNALISMSFGMPFKLAPTTPRFAATWYGFYSVLQFGILHVSPKLCTCIHWHLIDQKLQNYSQHGHVVGPCAADLPVVNDGLTTPGSKWFWCALKNCATAHWIEFFLCFFVLVLMPLEAWLETWMWTAQCHPWNGLHFVFTPNLHHVLWCCLLVCEVRQGVLFTCSTVVGDMSEIDSVFFPVQH